MLSPEIDGMLWVVLSAFMGTGVTIMSSVAKVWGLPFYGCLVWTYVICSVGLFGMILVKGELCALSGKDWLWIWARGFCGCGNYFLSLIAVAMGVSLGDAGALVSTNIVVAALLGWAFLGENLRPLQIISVGLCVVGATLVTKPEALFGFRINDDVPRVGYALGLASGVCSGCVFIAARKSAGISSNVMTLSTLVQAALWVYPLMWTSVVTDGDVDSWMSARVLIWFALVCFVEATAIIAMSIGSQTSPAAASSIIMTSVSMLLGYVSQVLIHNRKPDLITILGATSMLLAVVLMSAARSASTTAQHQRADVTVVNLKARLLPEEFDCGSSVSTDSGMTDVGTSTPTSDLEAGLPRESCPRAGPLAPNR